MAYLTALNAAYEALQAAHAATPDSVAFGGDRAAISEAMDLIEDLVTMQESVNRSASNETFAPSPETPKKWVIQHTNEKGRTKYFAGFAKRNGYFGPQYYHSKKAAYVFTSLSAAQDNLAHPDIPSHFTIEEF